METINFTSRPLTDAEYAREQVAFHQHDAEFGNLPQTAERHGFVATDDNGKMIGCRSGLAYKTAKGYCNYFFLTDLLVEKEYRGQGHGKKLLELLEKEIKDLGVKYIWAWTAGFEAPGFYEKMGYTEFIRMEDWYASGHASVGFKKQL